MVQVQRTNLCERNLMEDACTIMGTRCFLKGPILVRGPLLYHAHYAPQWHFTIFGCVTCCAHHWLQLHLLVHYAGVTSCGGKKNAYLISSRWRIQFFILKSHNYIVVCLAGWSVIVDCPLVDHWVFYSEETCWLISPKYKYYFSPPPPPPPPPPQCWFLC